MTEYRRITLGNNKKNCQLKRKGWLGRVSDDNSWDKVGIKGIIPQFFPNQQLLCNWLEGN